MAAGIRGRKMKKKNEKGWREEKEMKKKVGEGGVDGFFFVRREGKACLVK